MEEANGVEGRKALQFSWRSALTAVRRVWRRLYNVAYADVAWSTGRRNRSGLDHSGFHDCDNERLAVEDGPLIKNDCGWASSTQICQRQPQIQNPEFQGPECKPVLKLSTERTLWCPMHGAYEVPLVLIFFMSFVLVLKRQIT